MSERQRRVRIGGASLIAATLLFAAVFTYLAVTFDYPAILDRPADDVLPALLALGTAGRSVWLLYGLIPMLLVPTALGVRAAVRDISSRLGDAALWLAICSALCMMIGLLRWPTLHWALASEWPAASPESRASIAGQFATANFYLGNVIGEFLGELCLNGFFLVAAIALARMGRRRWLLPAGLAASVLGWIAMLRNAVPGVQPFAEINNNVLPLWMLVLGIALATTRVSTSSESSHHEPTRGASPIPQ